MATLRYDFSVIGTKNIDRAFASIERRAVQHNMRMSREFGGSRRGAATKSPAAASRVADMETKRRLASEVSAERKAAREKVRLDKWRQDMRNRHWQQEERNRRRAEAAEVRASQRALKERRRASGAIFGQAGSSVRNTTRAVGTMVGGTLAIGGGFMASATVGQQMRETAAASQLANQAGRPEIKGQLLREAQSVRGFTGEEALGGMSAFVEKTGNVDAARSLMGEMSKIAIATGTNLEDLGRTAGQAFTVLADQSGPQEAIKQTSELLKTLAQQGNMGAVEMSDLARDFGKLGAATRSFEGGAPELLRQMGAFAQIAVQRGGANNSAEAATAASRLAQDMVGEKRSKFEKILGKGALRSKTDKTKLRDPLEIMLDVLNKTGGDIMKTGDLFGGESKKIFAGLSSAYSAAEARAPGSGEEAVRAEFKKFAGAKLSDKDLEQRFQSRMSDPDIQFKEVMRDFNAQVGSELLPVITRLIPEFAKLLPHVTTAARIFGKLVEELADSPLMTLGKIIAAKVALDIATARIGDVIKGGIIDSLSGGGAGSGGGSTATAGGGGSRGLSIGNAVLNGVSIGTAAALTIMATGVVNFEASEVQMDQAGSRLNEMRDLLTALKGGDTSVLPRIRELHAKQREETGEITERNIAAKETASGIDSFIPDLMTGFLPRILGAMGIGEEEKGPGVATSVAETIGIINETQQKTNESIEKSSAEILKAAEKIAASADKMNQAGDKMSQVPGGGGPSRPAAPTI